MPSGTQNFSDGLGYSKRCAMLRFMKTKLFLALGLLLVAAAVDARNVYRWVEPDGTVTFSDRPLAKSAEIYVPVQRAPIVPTEQGDPVAERKKRKCQEARGLLEQYTSQSEIRRVDTDTGRIVRLEPEAREALISEARQDAQVWCDDV